MYYTSYKIGQKVTGFSCVQMKDEFLARNKNFLDNITSNKSILTLPDNLKASSSFKYFTSLYGLCFAVVQQNTRKMFLFNFLF